MEIKSLGRQTDFIFARFSGMIIDKGCYTLIKTPSNPGYHWGNYIVFDRAPRVGDLTRWKEIFDAEFDYYPEPHHYVFAWDTEKEDKGSFQEFLDDGFDFETAVVLTSKKLNLPKHQNKMIEVRKIRSDDEWQEVLNLQIKCADPKYLNEYYRDFKESQMNAYRKMSAEGLGHWFGAYLDGMLVGDLGIFYEGEIARYQSVETHSEYRQQGICGTLVYQSGQIALKDFGVTDLVMEADAHYHAARIYESVGFKKTETNFSLSWWHGGKKPSE